VLIKSISEKRAFGGTRHNQIAYNTKTLKKYHYMLQKSTISNENIMQQIEVGMLKSGAKIKFRNIFFDRRFWPPNRKTIPAQLHLYIIALCVTTGVPQSGDAVRGGARRSGKSSAGYASRNSLCNSTVCFY